jgi:hypothetical protein
MLSLIASMPSLAVALVLLKLAILAFVVTWALSHLGPMAQRSAPVPIPVKTPIRRP